MGAAESAPQAPAYQPTFLEQHVRAAGALQSPDPNKAWQGRRPGMGADAYAISEAKRANGLVKGPAHDASDAPVGSIAESWLMVQMKRTAGASEQNSTSGKFANDLPAPNVPAYSWAAVQVRKQLHPGSAGLSQPSGPADSSWLTGVAATPPARLQVGNMPAPPPSQGKAGMHSTANWAPWQTQPQDPTESDRSDSVQSECDLETDEGRATTEMMLAAPKTEEEHPTQASHRGINRRATTAASGTISERSASRSLFLERVKSLQAFHANHLPSSMVPTSLLTPARERSPEGDRSSRKSQASGKSSTPRRFPWMSTTPTQKDVYKMGRYDIVTTNLHGSYEVVKGSTAQDNVYRGIDAELLVA